MEKPFRKSQVIVYIQFFLIIVVLAGSGSLPEFNSHGALVLALGLMLGAWTLATNRPDNFNITHKAKEGAALCFNGPYRFLKHPMYLSVLLALAGICLMSQSWLSVMAWVGLVFVLDRKSRLEERSLIKRSGDYERYSMKTRRFIPCLY
jgi:protein-S-isoprenylcysteine O-methyltransferase Ste14